MDIDQIIRRNRRRIFVLTAIAALNYAVVLALLIAFFMWAFVSKANADPDGVVYLIVSTVTAVSVAFVYVWSKLHGIRDNTIADLRALPIKRGDNAMLDNLIDGLAIASGKQAIGIALVDDPAPNALAVGISPSESSIVLTTGLLEKCTRYEIEAVLAVKFCNIRRFDTALQSVGLACAQGAIVSHAAFRDDWKDPRDWFLIALTWPSMVVAELVRFAAFRFGDFGADRMALAATRHPEALDAVMARLDADPSVLRLRGAKETAPLWFEPVPHRDVVRAAEFRRWQGTPSLAERRKRLPQVRHDT